MVNIEPLTLLFYLVIIKLGSIIYYQDSWKFKTTYDIFL